MAGHYTGRWLDMFAWHGSRDRAVERRSVYHGERRAWEELHPEFLVDGWCYAPPRGLMESEWVVEPMKGMRDDGVPLCPGER